jgi:hypothetical protein
MVLAITIMGGIALYLHFRPMTMADHARKIAYAELFGDTDLLFDYMMPEEKELTGVTRESLREAYRLLIEPRIAGYRTIVQEETRVQGGGAQGSCRLVIRNDRGWQSSVYATPTLTDSKMGAVFGTPQLLMYLLFIAWHLEHLKASNGAPIDEVSHWKLTADDIERDAPTLIRLGIKGVVYCNMRGLQPIDLRFGTWDQWRRGHLIRYAQLTGKPAPKSEPNQIRAPSIG